MKKPLMVLPGRHPVHIAFADAIQADKYFVTNRVKKEQWPWTKAMNLYNVAMQIPSGYNDIVCESCYYYAALAKRFGRLKQSRIINFNGGPLLYHLTSGRISGFEKAMLMNLLQDVDGHIVHGEYGLEILKRLGEHEKPHVVSYPFVSDARISALKQLTPPLNSRKMLLIATQDAYLKGIDIALDALSILREEDNRFELSIIGLSHKDTGLKQIPAGVQFLPFTENLIPYFSAAGLCLQPSRGDTFSVAVLESLFAGIPAIVSKETGAKEIVSKLDSDLICELNANDLADKILAYYCKSENEKATISSHARKSVTGFTKEKQTASFNSAFLKLKNDLSI